MLDINKSTWGDMAITYAIKSFRQQSAPKWHLKYTVIIRLISKIFRLSLQTSTGQNVKLCRFK